MTTTTPMTNRTPIEWLWLAALALPALVLGLTLAWPAAAASPDPMVLAQAGAPAQVADAQPGMRREMHGRRGDMRGEGQRWHRHGLVLLRHDDRDERGFNSLDRVIPRIPGTALACVGLMPSLGVLGTP